MLRILSGHPFNNSQAADNNQKHGRQSRGHHRAPGDVEGHTDRGSHRGARQIHNRLTRFSSHLISYFYHRAPLRCGATRAYHQRPAQGGLALAPADKDQRRGPPQRPQQPFLFPPYSLFLSSSSATLRRHSRIPSATRSSAISSGRQSLLGSHGEPLSGGALGAPRHGVRGERQKGLPSRGPDGRVQGACPVLLRPAVQA